MKARAQDARRRMQLELDARLLRVHESARLLPSLAARGCNHERERMVEKLRRREPASPKLTASPLRIDARVRRSLDEARLLAREVGTASDLYLERLEELELELCMLENLGKPPAVMPLAARRFGRGADPILSDVTLALSLRQVAERILRDVAPTFEPPAVPARSKASGGPSLARLLERMASFAGLQIEIVVERHLIANAAAGERSVFLADRSFGAREAYRIAVHEVLGHLVAAANGRTQPLAIFSVGTADSLRDQEGLCILLEELAGTLDGSRLRTLAARVVATEMMHLGAEFDDVARSLIDDYGLEVSAAVTIAERAFRGGGVARDCAYLSGWLRVRQAYVDGTLDLHELRAGRLSLAALPIVERLRAEGLARNALYRPSLARSLATTAAGTSFETSPPSLVTSFTRFEAT